MKMFTLSLLLATTILLGLATFTGCESTDGGSTHTSSTVYYGVGFYDPWYHGDYHYDYDVVVTPPERPGTGVRPEHPIARPPEVGRPPAASPLPATRPATRPMPSIPSTPRPAPRGGGGGRRR